MRVLTFTSLFPNVIKPDLGGFVAQRMEAWAKKPDTNWTVIAPVPFFPRFPIATRWSEFSKIPLEERRGQWRVLHPRYFMLPRIGGYFQGESMARGSLSSLERLWREEGPFDLIDAHFVYPDGYAALKLGQRFHVPVVISARGTDVNLYPKLTGIGKMVAATINKAYSCIAVCRSLGEEMKRLGAEAHKVIVIPNGVDINKFKPLDRLEARTRLELPRDAFIYISVGSLIERKGHHLLIEAFSKANFNNNTRLYIIGAGPFQSRLNEQISKLKLADRVILTGHIYNDNLPDWYNAADCLCLCSSREGWANVIMESMACGTPVIATNVWGAPEILTRDDVGILVQRNVDSIADGMLTANRRVWNRRLIRKHVESQTWEATADSVHRVFEQVVDDWKKEV